MTQIKVLVAEDHDLVRAGFCALIRQMEGISILGEAREGHEAIQKALKTRPDIILLDITMPGLNGLEVTERLARKAPDIKAIVLSVHSDQEYVIKAFKAGAKGYVIKDSGVEELHLALKTVFQGGTFISPKVSGPLLERFLKGEQVEAEILSPRQKEILQLLAEGLSVKEIAQRLHLSVKTVDAHKSQIMQKTNIHDRAGLVRYAIKIGLVNV